MLETVVTAVVTALGEKGIGATRRFPASRLDKGNSPVVCVGVKSSRLLSSGAGDYLGTRDDAEKGRTELYGFRSELVLSLDIYSAKQGPEGCAKCFDAMTALLPGLPSGLKLKSLESGETVFDADTGMFMCPCRLECTAYLICQADEETGEFTDFILRGVLKNAE